MTKTKTILFIAAFLAVYGVYGMDIKVGYYVFVHQCSEVAEFKTESLLEAEKFIHSFYPEFCENLEYQFQFTPYYRVNCFKKEIYVEKMRINKRGKYKRIKHFKTYLK